MRMEMLQQLEGVIAGVGDPGLGPGGILTQPDRTAVAASPLFIHHAGQHVWGGARDLLQRGSHRLGDQLQPGQVAHRGQNMGGIGALRAAFVHEPGLFETGQRQVKQAIGAIALGEAVTEIGQHTVVEAGIVQLQGQGVLEIDATAHRLGCLSVRQIEQELQHTDRGQLGGRETGASIARIPVEKVLVAPQPVEPVFHPHRCRTARIARPRHLRGQGRDLLAGTETDGQRAPR